MREGKKLQNSDENIAVLSKIVVKKAIVSVFIIVTDKINTITEKFVSFIF